MCPKLPPKEYTKEEVRRMKQCPDCEGRGRFKTPSTMWYDDVTCAVCHGKGWIWNE